MSTAHRTVGLWGSVGINLYAVTDRYGGFTKLANICCHQAVSVDEDLVIWVNSIGRGGVLPLRRVEDDDQLRVREGTYPTHLIGISRS